MPEILNSPLTIRSSEFLTSVANSRKLPEVIRQEIAFAGRSNVGKSSLINGLLNRKKLAKTSSRPGKTQLVNYFLINEEFYLVDLPGYGFAKLPIRVKNEWMVLIERYLQTDRPRMVVLLIDIRTGMTSLDLQMAEWLQHLEIPRIICVTKADKLGRTKMNSSVRDIRKQAKPFGIQSLIPVSAINGDGLIQVHQIMLDFLYGKFPPKE